MYVSYNRQFIAVSQLRTQNFIPRTKTTVLIKCLHQKINQKPRGKNNNEAD